MAKTFVFIVPLEDTLNMVWPQKLAYGFNSSETQAVCRAWHVVNTGNLCLPPPTGQGTEWYSLCNRNNSLMSVEEKQMAIIQKIKLYPNPTNTNLVLEMPYDNIINSEVIIYNIFGEQLLKTQITNYLTQIDVSHLRNGTYFTEIKCGNSKKSTRFVVAH